MKVYAPNEQYTGISASVPFINGVGETDDGNLLKWFKSKGYVVEEKKTRKKKPGAEKVSEAEAAETVEAEKAPDNGEAEAPEPEK